MAKHAESPLDVRIVGSQFQPWKQNSDNKPDVLRIVIISYETLRVEDRRKEVLTQAGKKCWLVLDESHCVKTPTSLQTKKTYTLRRDTCISRVTILTGSPCDQSPFDLYSQFAMLDKAIIGCDNFYQFRRRYGKMGGFRGKKVIKYVNLADLNRRIKPYILRRKEEDVWDLPDQSHQVTPVPLNPRTWKAYKDMKETLVVFLNEADPSAPIAFAKNAAIAAIRLSQICAGYIAVEDDNAVLPLGPPAAQLESRED